jgi:F420H(2)-dependent quinone reductase
MSNETSTKTTEVAQMPDEWWKAIQQQAVKQVQETGTTDGLPAAGPAVLLTVTGAKSGIPRQVPLLRIEHDGSYLIAASKGGSSREPIWATNVRANPNVELQDGEEVHSYTAREVTGSEREMWWERAVAAQPAMTGYAAAADRLIALFVLDPA